MDFFGSDRMLHTCQLEVQWEREGAVQEPLQLRLTLDGAKEPFNFLTLICGEEGMYMDKMLLQIWIGKFMDDVYGLWGIHEGLLVCMHPCGLTK